MFKRVKYFICIIIYLYLLILDRRVYDIVFVILYIKLFNKFLR